MTKKEFTIFFALQISAALLLGFAIGLFLAGEFELLAKDKFWYAFFFPAMAIVIINILTYGKKYEEFKKSLK